MSESKPLSAANLGSKYECENCGVKFYDFGRPEPVCPKCGTAATTPRKRTQDIPETAPRQAASDDESETEEFTDISDDEEE